MVVINSVVFGLSVASILHLCKGNYLRSLSADVQDVGTESNTGAYWPYYWSNYSSSYYYSSFYNSYDSFFFFYDGYGNDYGWHYYYLSTYMNSIDHAGVMNVLCDLMDATDIESVYFDWNCDMSIESAVYCSWEGIHCVDDVILGLKLRYCSGTIPSSIVSLTTLRYFEISGSYFPSTIPSSICEMSSLEGLTLSNSFFTGGVPSCIFNLDQLLSLDLSQNYLTDIPVSISSNSSLQFLDVSHNELSEIPASIDTFDNLRYLDMSSNFITTIPESIGNCIELLFIALQVNYIGIIPDSIGNCTKLQFLGIKDNPLSAVPYSICNCKDLRILDLSHSYTFSISLTELPDTIGKCSKLQHLDVSYNQLTGLPDSMGNCGNLVDLYAGRNELTSLPVIIKWSKLQYLDLRYNKLIEIPYSVGNCSELVEVDLSGNALISLPDSLGNLIDLVYLDVSDNEITSLPSTLGGCLELFAFYANDNRLVSVSGFGDCNNLYYLDLSNNELSTLPDSIGNCVGLQHLEITDNLLTELTESIGYLVNLRYLVIEDNQLSTLPVSIGNCESLESLEASDNNLVSIPGSIFDLPELTYVYLRNNELVDLPLIGSCSELIALWLSHNLIADLPESIGNCRNIMYLGVSYNELSGIPDSIVDCTHLITLELHENQMTGTVPHGIGALYSIAFFSLYSNYLSGSIPAELSRLNYLYDLQLHQNLFSGKLVEELCHFPQYGIPVTVWSNRIDCYEACWSEFESDLFVHDRTTVLCAPTSYPTSMPSSPTMKPTEIPGDKSVSNNLIITVSVCGFVGLLLLVGFVLFRFYKYVRSKIRPSEYEIELINTLNVCPILKAIHEGTSLTPEFVTEHIQSASKKTPDGKTALDLIFEQGDKCNSNAVVVFLLVDYQLPAELKNNSNVTYECMCDNVGWGKLIQQNDERSLTVVQKVLKKYKSYVHLLSNSKDAFGRKYINIASVKCKDAINRVLFLHERFELFEGQPEYKTSTALVKFAYDHRRLRRLSANQEESVARKVALKFMSSEISFNKERANRLTNAADGSKYFIAILDAYDGDSEIEEQRAFRQDAIDKGYTDYPYCIVMEAAEQNLNHYIDTQRIAGSEWEEIRRLFKQLVICVEYLHSHSVIHGDLKPNNVVLLSNSTVRLIDFDNSVQFGVVSSVLKASTAYCPPEYFRLSEDFNSSKRISSRNEVNTLTSHPSQDIWALGALLYLLCTGNSLFFSNIDDNICDEDDLMILLEWDDHVRDRKLSKISDKLARNLVSLMLSKNVEKRIDALHVLEHPFLSGKQSSRLQGDKAEFDVFISYRVASDAHHAQLLFEALTQHGLKVWLDTQCLEAGKNWEVGFCEGLFKSAYFVCLISQEGMNNGETVSCDWTRLKADNPCDNVLLEGMLALELQYRGLISGIFPVFIGSSLNGSMYTKYYLNGRSMPDISVNAVDEKLRSHLDRQGCGLPYVLNRSVKSVVDEVVSNQGAFVCGELMEELAKMVAKIETMVKKA